MIDVGSSMADPIAGASGTKLDLAKRASAAALEDLAPRDNVGLWTLPTNDRSSYREVAPLTTLASDTSQLVRGLAPLGTASDEESLYATVRASVDEVRSSFASDRINAVIVLTGGGYALVDKRSSDELIEYLLHQPEEQRLRVFTIGYDPTSSGVLKQIAEASGGAFYNASGPVNIGEVLRNAMSNF